jgi:hypothetical protein
MQEAGVLRTLLGIEPGGTACTVRASQSMPLVRKGPYADTEEQLGGLCVIEVPDSDAALAWAKRAPLERVAVIEVRPARIVPIA